MLDGHRGLSDSKHCLQVLLARSCSGTGLGLAYLVATCYLLFTSHFRRHGKALRALQPMHLQSVAGRSEVSRR